MINDYHFQNRFSANVDNNSTFNFDKITQFVEPANNLYNNRFQILPSRFSLKTLELEFNNNLAFLKYAKNLPEYNSIKYDIQRLYGNMTFARCGLFELQHLIGKRQHEFENKHQPSQLQYLKYEVLTHPYARQLNQIVNYGNQDIDVDFYHRQRMNNLRLHCIRQNSFFNELQQPNNNNYEPQHQHQYRQNRNPYIQNQRYNYVNLPQQYFVNEFRQPNNNNDELQYQNVQYEEEKKKDDLDSVLRKFKNDGATIILNRTGFVTLLLTAFKFSDNKSDAINIIKEFIDGDFKNDEFRKMIFFGAKVAERKDVNKEDINQFTFSEFKNVLKKIKIDLEEGNDLNPGEIIDSATISDYIRKEKGLETKNDKKQDQQQSNNVCKLSSFIKERQQTGIDDVGGLMSSQHLYGNKQEWQDGNLSLLTSQQQSRLQQNKIELSRSKSMQLYNGNKKEF